MEQGEESEPDDCKQIPVKEKKRERFRDRE